MKYNFNKKIVSREDCINISVQAKKQGKKVGFTSGAYDLIHSGHIASLDKAKQECDILIIGLNTDKSIKQYKDERKPLLSQDIRQIILAGLESVDYVFLFDELNNNKNIELIQPNYYIKGPDYKTKKMTSASIVKKYGGEVKIVEHNQTTISTSNIINDILAKFITNNCDNKHIYNGLVLIDRDGVINKEVNYLNSADQFELIEGTIDGIRLLNENNYAVAIITNQPGIDLGLYTSKDLLSIHKKMIGTFHKNKIRLDRIFVTPNTHPDSKYKKPNPGMIHEAINYFKLNSDKIYMIGDRRSDSKAAKEANNNIITIGVETGYGQKDTWVNHSPDKIVKDILEACQTIVS